MPQAKTNARSALLRVAFDDASAQFLVLVFLLVVIPRVRLFSSSEFLVSGFSPRRDSSSLSQYFVVISRVCLSELVTSREARDACRINCDVSCMCPFCSFNP